MSEFPITLTDEAKNRLRDFIAGRSVKTELSAKDILYGFIRQTKMSIEKWKKILAGTEEDKKWRNCELCLGTMNIVGVMDCVRCPIFGVTGERSCKKTPYEDWAKLGIVKISPYFITRVAENKISMGVMDQIVYWKYYETNLGELEFPKYPIAKKFMIDLEIEEVAETAKRAAMDEICFLQSLNTELKSLLTEQRDQDDECKHATG